MNESQSLRAKVRAVVKTLGDFKRQDVYDAFPGLDPRTEVGPAFDSLVKVSNPDRCVVCVGKGSKRDDQGGRAFWRVYRYVDLQAEDKFALPIGAVNRGGARNKAHAEAQRTPSGYPARHFTAPFRAPTEDGPDGFPPRFPWDSARGYVPPSAISQLQAILRRPMDRAEVSA